jgi:hypothetical protein
MDTEPQPRWAPQPGPQAEAIAATWCQELLFGGSAGGGKTDYLLGDYLQDVPKYADAWQGVVFRRSYRELEEIVTRSLQLYPPTGGVWEATRHRWVWSNGATLRLRYLERDVDVTRYQGHAYAWIGFDELGQFPSPYAYRYLRSRLRSAKPVPTKRMRATANPGGAGHHWLKAMFIDPEPLGFQPLTDPETGAERMFVPSRLTDNQILLGADPHYAMRLKGMGSPELVRAMLEGDWSVIVGSFFPEFSLSQHVIPVFTPPEHWLRFRSFDWGSARPFAVGWWAQVADGGKWPVGALIKYREWYGSSGEPNVGLRMTAEQVADGIKVRESGEQIAYGVADPSIFAQDGGPSIAERMFARGVTWRPADNTRIARHGAMGGWDLFRQRLRGEDGKPMAYWMSCCRDAIRTIPAMQHDDARPEDLASELEDHAVDADRYAFVSRPWMPAPESAKPPPRAMGEIRADMLVERNARGGRL